MNRRLTVLLLALCALAPPGLSVAQPARKVSAPHVTVELVAAQPALVAGGDTWLGLRFILEPGWHIYWVNPGDSGGPPTALWTPSSGLTPRDFEWPAPERIPYGQLVNYGYHGDVVLPFRLGAAAGTSTGTLTANVTWLVCKELCVSGKGRVAIAFPLTGDAEAASPAWKALIEASRARVPRPAPASWRVDGRDEGDTFAVTVVTGARETGATFFPLEGGVLEEAALQSPAPLDRGLRLTLRKSDLLTKTPPALRGVLTLASGASYTITIPLAVGRQKGK
jgi:thiol:disulfide interchange protein DsbD